MCEAGRLQHPQTREHLKKRTQILTTSPIMARMIEQQQCQHDHTHRTIEGSCKHKGSQRLPLTQYTELCTSVFGRRLSRTILSSLSVRESRAPTQQVEVLVEDVAQAILAAEELPEPKRRRLESKSIPEAMYASNPRLHHGCTEVLREVESLAPRVGKIIIRDGHVFDKIQALFPQVKLHAIEACKGVDRLVRHLKAPPRELHHSADILVDVALI